MKIPLYQVDAFTNKIFGGNPAAVCVLQSWLPDRTLQNIAAENNLAETAFVVEQNGLFDLRWFTPLLEVDLCGHATLASAFVVFSFLKPNRQTVEFQTTSGRLTVCKSGELLCMNLPSRPPLVADTIPMLTEALGANPIHVLKSRDILAVFQDATQIKSMKPDFEIIKKIEDCFAVIVTAPGDSSDFVSRFFAPNAGIPEDPVTGSAHCTLVPYWANRLGKKKLVGLQVSQRGGELFCEDQGTRVQVAGNAVLFLKGEINL